MKITKQRLKQIIKEEFATMEQQATAGEKASTMGSDIKRLLADPKVNQLADSVAGRVAKLGTTQKAVVAAAILNKMGFSQEDMDQIRTMVGKQMDAPEAEPESQEPVVVEEGEPVDLSTLQPAAEAAASQVLAAVEKEAGGEESLENLLVQAIIAQLQSSVG